MEELILLGKYRIISVLGTGSFSTVYLAEHLKLKVYRAIKCIPKALAQKSSFPLEETLYHEADLLKNLNHPGIPLIYDIDDDDNNIYLIEEYVQGESLDAFVLHHEDISPTLVIDIGIQLCDILDYLHNLSPCPILHQDLKPEHIILCGSQVKIIDFGIASFFTGIGNHFQIYGTEAYAAPEAMNQLPVDKTLDLYSLGRVLEFISEHTVPDCSPRLIALIREALSESPELRPASAADFKASLCSFLNQARSSSSHLIRNIAVIGSHSGVGCTHISIAMTCAMNRENIPAVYMPMDNSYLLEDIAAVNHHLRERDGIYVYRDFVGVPNYGENVELPVSPQDCIIRDFGATAESPDAFADYDLILVVSDSSDWNLSAAVRRCKAYSLLPGSVFLCNYGRKDAAKKLARLIGKPVWCFPIDSACYQYTREKDRLISAIVQRKGGKLYPIF